MEIRLCLTKDQQEVVLTKARTKVLFSGRRWGKTCTLAGAVIQKAFERSGNLIHYVSPSYARSRDFYKLLEGIAAPLIQRQSIQPVPNMEFTNGSRLTCRSFDRPNLLRGDASDLVALDEACYTQEDDVNAVIRPMLSDRRGTLFLASTPRGYDWVHKLYQRGQERKFGTRSWLFPTSAGPCFRGEEGRQELELVRSTLPKVVFEQEYECSFLHNIARVFAQDDLDRCTVSSPPPLHPVPGRRYALGVDIGRVKDHGAMVLEDDQGLVVLAEQIPLGMSYDMQAEKARSLCQKWNAHCILDTSGGGMGGNNLGPDAVISVYRNRIANVREMAWNALNKEKMVQSLSVSIEQQKITIPSEHRTLLAELAAYEFYLRPGGRYRYSAPEGKRDDLVSALLMANLVVRNNWLPSGTGKPVDFAW
jgi:phage FluMu gp28-like protein